ncbi:MAG TPA: aminoglycoside phosphotransferase family protein [Candidatus Binataceae bacterium]|nr:aminoglycoside phosphotransferase family protein [Candidatus Binataceae bacterium]
MRRENTRTGKASRGRRGEPRAARVLRPPALLSSVDEIDRTWMQSVFAQAQVAVPRIAKVAIEPIGHGNMSETVRVELAYDSEPGDAPRSVVCKFHARDVHRMEMAALFGPYRREAGSYALLGPQPPLRVPRLYHAEVSADNRQSNLVFEDLSPFCEPGDQLAGCGIAEARAVIAELSGLHRRFWSAPELSSMPWMPSRSDLPAHGAAILHQRYTELLSDEEFRIIDESLPAIAEWLETPPRTLTFVHGDARVDNIMFDRRNPAAVRAYFIDWQGSRSGDAASDVAYFLSSSISPQDRRSCERELVSAHAAAIAEVDPSYTPDAAFAAYRRNIVSGLHMTLVATCVIPYSTPHVDKMLTILARRNCAAIQDWR